MWLTQMAAHGGSNPEQHRDLEWVLCLGGRNRLCLVTRYSTQDHP